MGFFIVWVFMMCGWMVCVLGLLDFDFCFEFDDVVCWNCEEIGWFCGVLVYLCEYLFVLD